MDLRVQPVEQPRPGERLVAERGRLDLAGLDRIAHAGLVLDAFAGGLRDQRTARTDRDRSTRRPPPSWTKRDRIGRRESWRRVSATVNETERRPVGHGAHGADEGSSDT